MPVIGFDHIQIAAPRGCEDEARRFFVLLLGFEELPKPEALRARGGCWFRVGQMQLHVGVDEDFRPAKKAHPAFAVSRIEALFAKLEVAGVPCEWDHSLDGVRRFYATDPWGNRLEFTETVER